MRMEEKEERVWVLMLDVVLICDLGRSLCESEG